MKTRYFSIFFILTFLVVSCTSSAKFDESIGVNIQSTESVFSTSEKAQISLTNSTWEVLHLNYCGPTLIFKLETKVQDNWESYAGGVCLALYSSEFVPTLKPGETKVIELGMLDSGIYRYNLAFTLSFGESQIQEVSTEFLVQ